MHKQGGRHGHRWAIPALLLSWHMLAKDLTPSSAFWLLRQLYDPSTTSNSGSSHGQSRAGLGTLPLICDFFASLRFVPFPRAAVLLLSAAFFHPSSWLTRDTTQGKTGPKVLQIRALCDPVPPLPALQDMQSVPFVTHVQGEKGNLTPDRKARDLWHLWSIFQQCNSHCINYTQTVLSARLLIAVNIMN